VNLQKRNDIEAREVVTKKMSFVKNCCDIKPPIKGAMVAPIPHMTLNVLKRLELAPIRASKEGQIKAQPKPSNNRIGIKMTGCKIK